MIVLHLLVTLMPFVLKLPKTAKEKGFLGENNVVQFSEAFCGWRQNIASHEVGSWFEHEAQFLTCCGKANYYNTIFHVLTGRTAVSWYFCSVQRKNWMTLKADEI